MCLSRRKRRRGAGNRAQGGAPEQGAPNERTEQAQDSAQQSAEAGQSTDPALNVQPPAQDVSEADSDKQLNETIADTIVTPADGSETLGNGTEIPSDGAKAPSDGAEASDSGTKIPSNGEKAAADETEEASDKPAQVKKPPRQTGPLARAIHNLFARCVNAVYDYGYFVGIQLLRSTRGKRRRLIHYMRSWREAAAARRAKKSFRFRRYVRKSWSELIAPFTELRAHYHDYLKALSNARRYGTSSEVSAIYLRIVGFTLSRLWRILKTLLNYVAPIAACVVCVLTIQYFTGRTLALRVEYNGIDLGYISSESVFTQAENDMKTRMRLDDVLVADPTQEDAAAQEQQTQNARTQADLIRPVYQLAAVREEEPIALYAWVDRLLGVPRVELSDADALTNQMIQAISKSENNPDGFAVEEAAGLYVDGTYIGAVKDGHALLQLLYDMQEQYREPGDEDADISFVKKVQVREGLYPSGESGSIRPLGEIKEILNKEERGKKVYTVVEGDTPIIIAAKNGISLDDLIAMNPDVETSLLPGDELLIANSVPYLGVKVTKTIRYEEDIEYTITQQTNPEENIGYTHTIQKGEKGLREITAEVVMVDGIETERNITNRTVIKEPVNQIIEVGGNKPLITIPRDSTGTTAPGAWAWPTVGGSINPGFRGYWGHTGSDISWSGCYGSPVLASADGTVVAAGWGGMYGYRIIIDHGGGYQTVYAHCSALYVQAGQQVSQGDTIAAIGQTGNTTGPHLHFEVRINGTPVDAAPYLYS